MADDNDDSSVEGVRKSEKLERTAPVEQTGSVEKVEKVGRVGSVKGAEKAGGAGAITPEERDRLLNMVEEEAEKLFENSSIPEERREIITKAVKMAIDAGIAEEDAESSKKSE